MANENGVDNFKIFMILDSHNSEVFDPAAGSFHIGINQAPDFMSLLDNAVQVQVGYHTHVRVIPSVYVSSEGFRALPQSTRKCKYQSEVDDRESILRYEDLSVNK